MVAKFRIAASALTVGLALSLTGCGMITPVATQDPYDPSDGVSVTFEDVAVRNIMVITADTEYGVDSGNLIFTAANTSTKPTQVTVAFENSAGSEEIAVDIDAGQILALGVGKNEPLPLTGIDTPAGAMMELVFSDASGQERTVKVPVLDSTLIEYQDLGR